MDLVTLGIIGWGVSAAIIIMIDLVQARQSKGVLDADHPWQSVLSYAAILLFSPILLVGFVFTHAPNLPQWLPWWITFGRAVDPYAASEKKWPTDRSQFLDMLTKRRKLFDPRLKGLSTDRWPTDEVGDTLEAVILDAMEAYRDLKSGGAEDWYVWEKLDVWLDVNVTPMPEGSGISDYLADRLKYVDPGLPELNDRVLSGHLDICLRWLDKNKPMNGKGWPARSWLTQQLTSAEYGEFDFGDVKLGTPAVRLLGRSDGGLTLLNLRMREGDEVWHFRSPPPSWQKLRGVAGISLVHDGRAVYSLVTLIN